jgi:hypothetical protein
LEWQLPVRVLIHIADAPAHGSKFHNLGPGDTKKDFDLGGEIMKDLLLKLKGLEISYFFSKILEQTDKASFYFLLRKICGHFKF